jgi:hypothetical protein
MTEHDYFLPAGTLARRLRPGYTYEPDTELRSRAIAYFPEDEVRRADPALPIEEFGRFLPFGNFDVVSPS